MNKANCGSELKKKMEFEIVNILLSAGSHRLSLKNLKEHLINKKFIFKDEEFICILLNLYYLRYIRFVSPLIIKAPDVELTSGDVLRRGWGLEISFTDIELDIYKYS